MKIIGITGPTGAGKTTALTVLRQLGAAVIDADAVYHQLLADSRELQTALTQTFGQGIWDRDHRYIDRKKLAEAVYPDRFRELNALTHPWILAEIDNRLEQARQTGCPAAAIDAIALVESGMGTQCDVIVSVLASLETRIPRIMRRDGVDEAYARRRALRQKPDAFFRAHSDFILENADSDTAETFQARAGALFQGILDDTETGNTSVADSREIST